MKENKRISIFIFIIFAFYRVSNSQNLVPNYSFENHNSPNVDSGFNDPYYGVHGWDGFLTCDLHYDGFGGTDIGGSNWGFQQPFSGDAMAGIRMYHDDYEEWHEFIFTKLADPLEAGVVYSVSVRVSPSEGSLYATDDFGICLSKIKPPPREVANGDDTYVYYERYSPQIENPEGAFITNANTWTEVSGSFKAEGGEEYLIIGNFKPDSLTSFKEQWDDPEQSAYLFVDHVVLEKCPLPICVEFPLDTILCGKNTILLDATTDQAIYNWNTNSNEPIQEVSESGNYWVDVTAGGCTWREEINIEVINDFSLGEDTVICDDSPLVLNPELENANYLWNNTFTDPKFKIEESGSYWVEVNTNECLYRDTIEVKFIDDYTSLYPNPSNGIFKYESTLDPIDSYRLFQSSGKLVGENKAFNENLIEFDITDISPSSLYLLEVETSGCKLRKKVIVIPQ